MEKKVEIKCKSKNWASISVFDISRISFVQLQFIRNWSERLIACIFYFVFDIVNSLFLDGDVSRAPSYGVYMSQLIRFARVSSHLIYFKRTLLPYFFQQQYRYHKLRFLRFTVYTSKWFQNMIRE